MSDGNKRILGDVWINEENLNRQREFFRDIIESYQYKYGGEFDASTLQGLQASDFATAEQGRLAENALHAPLWLGKKGLVDVEDRQYIFTDAVLLDKDPLADEESSAYKITNIDWFEDLQDNNLTDALVRIYEKVKEITDNKVDLNIYNTFVENEFNPIKKRIDDISIEFIDHTTGETRIGINADLVNGLRPILITEQAYNDLKNSRDEEDQKIVNDWRNIFIFVESLPGDYDQPWEYSLTDPYSFKIEDNYLQVKNNISENWVKVAPLQDFLLGADFENVLYDYLDGYTGFDISLEALLDGLQSISPTIINDNWRDYPFLSSSLRDNYIAELTIDDSQDYITSTTDSNGFKNVDIDLLQILKDKAILDNSGTSPISSIQGQLNSHTSDLLRIEGSVNSISSRINNDLQPSSNQHTTDIAEIKTQLNTISNQLSTINSKISALQNQEWVAVSSGSNQDTHYYVNKVAKLVLFRIYCIISSDSTGWKNIPDIAPIPASYRPRARTYFTTSYGYGGDILVSVNTGNDSENPGKFQYKSRAGAKSNNVKEFYVSGIFSYG